MITNFIDLRQPSIFEDINSTTTYEVVFKMMEEPCNHNNIKFKDLVGYNIYTAITWHTDLYKFEKWPVDLDNPTNPKNRVICNDCLEEIGIPMLLEELDKEVR